MPSRASLSSPESRTRRLANKGGWPRLRQGLHKAGVGRRYGNVHLCVIETKAFSILSLSSQLVMATSTLVTRRRKDSEIVGLSHLMWLTKLVLRTEGSGWSRPVRPHDTFGGGQELSAGAWHFTSSHITSVAGYLICPGSTSTSDRKKSTDHQQLLITPEVREGRSRSHQARKHPASLHMV